MGYQLFANDGFNGLVVEKMAKMLKVNKSSFYWYFHSKGVFMDEIVKYWVQMETDQTIQLVDSLESPLGKWQQLLKIAFKKDTFLEFIFHLKKYAIEHADIQKLIDKIDEKRLLYVSSLLIELGVDKESALIKANIFYKYLIGYHEMIRYKEQGVDYLKVVSNELKHFIPINK